MWELVEKIFVVIENLVGFVVVEFITIMSQMVVCSQSSKLRGSMGRAGIDAVSSAQSRRMGIGVEHSGTGLRSGGTGGGGREAMAMGGSGTSTAV